MKKLDIIITLVVGEIIAWFFYSILKNLDLGLEIKFLAPILAIGLPIVSLFCFWLSWLIGKKILFVFQLAKFLLIGGAATLFDLGVLNLMIMFSGLSAGLAFSIFKGISFLVATCAKYFGDKFWAFEKMEKSEMGKEFIQFFVVTLIGMAINVGIASFCANTVGPQFGLSAKLWANVAGVIAAFGTFAWNFVGYKFIVFKK